MYSSFFSLYLILIVCEHHLSIQGSICSSLNTITSAENCESTKRKLFWYTANIVYIFGHAKKYHSVQYNAVTQPVIFQRYVICKQAPVGQPAVTCSHYACTQHTTLYLTALG